MTKTVKTKSIPAAKTSPKKAKNVEFDLFDEKTWHYAVDVEELVAKKVIDSIDSYEERLALLGDRLSFFSERKDIKHALLLKRRYPEAFAAMQIKTPMSQAFTKAIDMTEAIRKLELFIETGTEDKLPKYKEMVPLLKMLMPYMDKESTGIDSLRAIVYPKITGNAAWDVYLRNVNDEIAEEELEDGYCGFCCENGCDGECEDEEDEICCSCSRLSSECQCDENY